MVHPSSNHDSTATLPTQGDDDAKLFVFVGGVCVLVFSIIGLVREWDTAKHCQGSALHIYMTVTLSLVYVTFGYIYWCEPFKEDGVATIYTLVVLNIVLATLVIWGFVEVFDKSCPDLDHTLLWDMAIVLLSFLSLGSLISIISLAIRCICPVVNEEHDLRQVVPSETV